MEFYEKTIAQYADYIKKRWAYIPAWPDNIEILIPKEFGKELNSLLGIEPQVLFVTKSEYDYPRNWKLCLYSSSQISILLYDSGYNGLDTVIY
jgi:hypothetical protein